MNSELKKYHRSQLFPFHRKFFAIFITLGISFQTNFFFFCPSWKFCSRLYVFCHFLKLPHSILDPALRSERSVNSCARWLSNLSLSLALSLFLLCFSNPSALGLDSFASSSRELKHANVSVRGIKRRKNRARVGE